MANGGAAHLAKSNRAWRLSSEIWISTAASGLTWIRMKGSFRGVGPVPVRAASESMLVGLSACRTSRFLYALCCLLVSCIQTEVTKSGDDIPHQYYMPSLPLQALTQISKIAVAIYDSHVHMAIHYAQRAFSKFETIMSTVVTHTCIAVSIYTESVLCHCEYP